MNYKSYSKSQLVELLGIIESELGSVNEKAKEASEKYSTELLSKLSFEVGYLTGGIKNVLITIESYKEWDK